VVVEVAGAIELATVALLEEAIDVVTEITPRVVVNLSDVNYLDSSALKSLTPAESRPADRQVVLIVVKPANPVVSRLFDVGPLPERLVVVDSLDHALVEPRPSEPSGDSLASS
jgi:anti-anti-sigma factor